MNVTLNKLGRFLLGQKAITAMATIILAGWSERSEAGGLFTLSIILAGCAVIVAIGLEDMGYRISLTPTATIQVTQGGAVKAEMDKNPNDEGDQGGSLNGDRN